MFEIITEYAAVRASVRYEMPLVKIFTSGESKEIRKAVDDIKPECLPPLDV